MASCGAVEGAEGRRFESLAEQVADIPLNAEPRLRPDIASQESHRLKVEVMDPHDLWDARDGGLRGLIERSSTRAAEAAAPGVAEAVAQEASLRIAEVSPTRPAISAEPAPRLVPAADKSRATLQLGAYSSPAAAEAAWRAVSNGSAGESLKGLAPRYETVQVNGRALTRLRIAAPTDQASAICQAVASSDPWCARRT
jgi:hypothetical protein